MHSAIGCNHVTTLDQCHFRIAIYMIIYWTETRIYSGILFKKTANNMTWFWQIKFKIEYIYVIMHYIVVKVTNNVLNELNKQNRKIKQIFNKKVWIWPRLKVFVTMFSRKDHHDLFIIMQLLFNLGEDVPMFFRLFSLAKFDRKMANTLNKCKKIFDPAVLKETFL